MEQSGYFLRIQAWRDEREKKISGPHGWISTAGLFWLEEGENRMGSGSSNPIRLLEKSAPEYSGVFIYRDGLVKFQAQDEVEILYEGRSIKEAAITVDEDSSEVIHLNDLELYVIRRGQRLGVRIFDPDNPGLKKFEGLSWFLIDTDYCLEAAFVPFPKAEIKQVINILGDMESMEFPGIIEFLWNGQKFQLEPVVVEDGKLWIMFCDVTNRDQTYPAGRYLTCDPPQGGRIILDFNKAYNPPCAYTDYATCPIPPLSNHLPFPVLAGEQRFR